MIKRFNLCPWYKSMCSIRLQTQMNYQDCQAVTIWIFSDFKGVLEYGSISSMQDYVKHNKLMAIHHAVLPCIYFPLIVVRYFDKI